MGNAVAADTIPVLCTMVDVHNPKSQDQFYFCNVSSGGASTKVIGRSQTLSVEVGITTILTMTVYECPEPVFTPETGRCVGVLRIPVERMAERYSSGIFQQWFNLDTKTDPRAPVADHQKLATQFEEAYTNAVADVYQPKLCISVIGSAFEVERSGRHTCSIFVGEDVKTQAGPDLKALIASHKQQAAYIDALHEELRKATTPSYRPAAANAPIPVPAPVVSPAPVVPAPAPIPVAAPVDGIANMCAEAQLDAEDTKAVGDWCKENKVIDVQEIDESFDDLVKATKLKDPVQKRLRKAIQKLSKQVHHTPVMSTMSTPFAAPVMYHSTPTAAPVHTQFFPSAVKPFRAAPAVDSVPRLRSIPNPYPADSIPMTGPVMHSMQVDSVPRLRSIPNPYPADSIPMTGPVMHSMQVCECGNHFMDDARFCRKCGKRRPAQAGNADQYTNAPGMMSYEHPHLASMTPSMIAPVQ